MQITMPSFSRRPAFSLPRLLASVPRRPRVSAVVVLLLVLTMMSAGWLTGGILPETNQIDLRFRYAPPWPLEGSSPTHLLGTDRLGRDLLSRMLIGAQNSLVWPSWLLSLPRLLAPL
jgi:peptide/nickel transport system permease protein